VIKWNVSWNPAAPKLTMSNRFEVSNVDILPFEPYYDKYSPFVFKTCFLSGTLIFDFDNGNIGSTNEVKLSKPLFYIKHDFENAQVFETNVPDLVKYLTSSFGDVVFDFKIKGDMSSPKFFLGPISKEAIARMAIDKISSIMSKAGNSNEEASEIDKAKQYIDMFKGLIKSK
jgi:hypothetical protein